MLKYVGSPDMGNVRGNNNAAGFAYDALGSRIEERKTLDRIGSIM